MELSSIIYNAQYRIRQRIDGSLRGLLGRTGPTAAKVPARPKRVLFVLSGLIGDSIMSIPSIRAARQAWPEARIAVVGKSKNHELLKASSFYDDFFECDADPYSLRRSADVNRLAAWLREQKFEIAIILLGDQFAKLLANAGIPVRVGVAGGPLDPFLTHVYDIGKPEDWGPAERLNALRVLGIEPGPPAVLLDVSEADRRSALERLEAEASVKSGEFVILHPFASSEIKTWPLDRIASLAELMETEFGLKAVVIGGPAERAAMGSSAVGPAVDMTGRFTLPELVGVVHSARLMITTDSGPLHIAAALGTPIIGLFRERSPAHASTHGGVRALIGESPACVRECTAYRCAVLPCREMDALRVESVFRAVRDQLNK